MLRLVFFGPWYLKAAVATVFLFLAGLFYVQGTKDEAEKALALARGMPDAVSLDDFDPARDIHPADEVHVIGWINTDFTYRLTETRESKSGSYDVVRKMFVIFSPSDGIDSRQPRAALLMTEAQAEALVADLPDLVEGPAGDFFSFRLNGAWTASPELENMANDAFAEQGLTKAPGFFFMEPWQGGRQAALAPNPDMVLGLTGLFGGIGLLAALVSWISFRRSRARAKAATAAALLPADPAGEPSPVAMTPAKRQKTFARKMVVACLALVGMVFLIREGALNYLGALVPLVLLAALVLGLQRLKQLAGQGLSQVTAPALAKLLPGPAAAVPSQPQGPVQTTLRLGEQLSARGGKWLPFALGVAVLGAASLFNLLPDGGLPTITAPIAEIAATPVPDAPAADPASGNPFVLGVLPLSIITIALVMLGLLSLRIASRRAGGRDVPVPHERWTRIAQEARR